MKRLRVDFNERESTQDAVIPENWPENRNVSLTIGESVLLCDDTFEVQAVVAAGQHCKHIGKFDRTTIRNFSDLEIILRAAPVVPVLIVEDWKAAVPLARALAAGGLTAIEITLRTPNALDAIRAVAAEVEGAHVGAGTVLTRAQFADAERANAKFAVSPGATSELIQAAADSELPLLPGASTATEAMTLLEFGYSILKFFPAEPAGGIAALKALASPLPAVRFCPTGGITPTNAPAYLALPNVICVGGSWVAPQDAITAGDWARLEKLASEAAQLGKAQ